jgi:hypothetical protein
VSPYEVAGVYARLGNREQAFSWLEKAYAGRDSGIVALNVEPVFQGLRADPRLQNLVKRIGLPQ